MSVRYIALTAYGVEIPRAFADRQAALAWAQDRGPVFPGCVIVQQTVRGPRVIHRQPSEARA